MTVVPLLPAADPEALLRQRVAAFRRGDFGFIYDSYHPEAPFRQQFPDREDYLRFAGEEIAPRVRIARFRILKTRRQQGKAEVIFHQLLFSSAGAQESFELALLEMVDDCWCYWGSQRLDRAGFRGRPEDLDFADFAAAAEKIFF